MATIGALAQYQANTTSGTYALKNKGIGTQTGRTSAAALKPNADSINTKAPENRSAAGDTLKLESTGTRAKVAAATSATQTAQAAITTATAVDTALNKTRGILDKMAQTITDYVKSGDSTAAGRGQLHAQLEELGQQLDKHAEGTKFAGHAILNGNFKVAFTVNSNKVTIDVTTPNGGKFNREGLSIDKAMDTLAATANAEKLMQNAAKNGVPGAKTGTTAAGGANVNFMKANFAAESGQLAVQGMMASLQGADHLIGNILDNVRKGVNSMRDTLAGVLPGNAPSTADNAAASGNVAKKLAAAAREAVLSSAGSAVNAQANVPTAAAMRLLAS